MSSGFSGGVPDFSAGRRSIVFPNNTYTTNNLNTQQPFRSQLAGILPDPNSQIHRPDTFGKRSLAEFQQQHNFLQNYLRNVKPRPNYSLSPLDFPSSISSASSAVSINPRYGLPIHKVQPFSNLAQNKGITLEGSSGQDQTEKKTIMNHRLQELEKQLFGEDEDEDDDAEEGVSVVTNSEWSDTIKNLINPAGKPISPSPTSSSSSCCSTSASPQFPNPKQAFVDAAAAVSDGKVETAAEILTRLQKVGNSCGTSEQRLTAYMVSALKPRVNHSVDDTATVYGEEHTASTQMLFDVSPCFKLGFMAANLAILEAVSEKGLEKIHVLDFDIGRGGQYVHLLHALAAKKRLENRRAAVLKLTAFMDFSTPGEEKKLNVVGEGLKSLASKIGVSFSFGIRNLNANELCREKLDIQPDRTLAVNFAFKLYKLPDESVSTENLRDDLLRRVKGLSPAVVTVVEQEMNTNTAPLTARVRDAYEYYASLFDSLDSTLSRESPERVRIESGLGRRMRNSVACEGRERVERCEVFGKWRARMSMAGFGLVPVSRLAVDSLRSKVEAGTRGNPGFSVNEESGGIRFGWMGRTLTVASAWR